MKFAIFQLLIVLFFCKSVTVMGQTPDITPVIELSETDFSIERPFTISVTLPNTTARPKIVFPNLASLTKSGTTATQTTTEINGKNVVSQVIKQEYLAQNVGTFRIAPFAILVNGVSIRSTGIVLTVRPVAGQPSSPLNNTVTTALAEKGGAFLSLTASSPAIYEGQGVTLRLIFYAAENYPYELRFDQVEQQLQTITRQIRPAGAWEENAGISELKPRSIQIKGRPFREFLIYQSTFFPLRSQRIQLPAVTLMMLRVKTATGLPATGLPATTLPPTATKPTSATDTEPVSFVSQPLTIEVKPLPGVAAGKLMPVGTFRLIEQLTQSVVAPGQSTAYEFRVEGIGNIATLPAPTVTPGTDLDVFPPEIRRIVNRQAIPIDGQKSFKYFLVARQKGTISLRNTFEWVYFDPQTARFDTLRPSTTLRVGGLGSTFDGPIHDSVQAESAETSAQNSIYAGITQLDSHQQPLNLAILVRAVADVLIVLMLLGMIYIFLKK